MITASIGMQAARHCRVDDLVGTVGPDVHAQPADGGMCDVVVAAPDGSRRRTKPACAEWRIRASGVIRAMT
jgi:hypothetical protein